MLKKLKWLLNNSILTASFNMLLPSSIWKSSSMVALPESHAKINHKKMFSLSVPLNPITSSFTSAPTFSENRAKTLSLFQKKLKTSILKISLKSYSPNHSNLKNHKLLTKWSRVKLELMDKTVASSDKKFEPSLKSFNMIKNMLFLRLYLYSFNLKYLGFFDF